MAGLAALQQTGFQMGMVALLLIRHHRIILGLNLGTGFLPSPHSRSMAEIVLCLCRPVLTGLRLFRFQRQRIKIGLIQALDRIALMSFSIFCRHLLTNMQLVGIHLGIGVIIREDMDVKMAFVGIKDRRVNNTLRHPRLEVRHHLDRPESNLIMVGCWICQVGRARVRVRVDLGIESRGIAAEGTGIGAAPLGVYRLSQRHHLGPPFSNKVINRRAVEELLVGTRRLDMLAIIGSATGLLFNLLSGVEVIGRLAHLLRRLGLGLDVEEMIGHGIAPFAGHGSSVAGIFGQNLKLSDLTTSFLVDNPLHPITLIRSYFLNRIFCFRPNLTADSSFLTALSTSSAPKPLS